MCLRKLLILPYLGILSLQTRTKLRKSLKGILNCCKLQILFKSQNKLAKAFHFKDRIPKELTSDVVYEFNCGLRIESYYGECVRLLNPYMPTGWISTLLWNTVFRSENQLVFSNFRMRSKEVTDIASETGFSEREFFDGFWGSCRPDFYRVFSFLHLCFFGNGIG